MTHCLPVRVPDAEVPITFTVYLIPDARGTFLVTCRELPDLMTHGEDERDALARAEKAIKATLATHPGSPEIPS